MRVLIVPSWFPSEIHPLSGIFFLEQATLLAQHNPNVEVHVMATPGPRLDISPRLPLEAFANIRRWVGAKHPLTDHAASNLFIHRFLGVQISKLVSGGGLAIEARRMQQFARTIELSRGEFDVVHAHVCYPGGWLAAQLAQFLNCPLVLSEHMSPFPFPDLCDADGNMSADARASFDAADLVTAVSQAQANAIEAHINREVLVVPNFIDESAFVPARPAARPRLISVGGLVEQKGFDILLKALAQAKHDGISIELMIVGDGPEKSALEQLATRLRIRDLVIFAGSATRDELPGLFHESTGFVLASRHESFGVVVIEAMASGLPSLVTDCGGPSEIVDSATGIVVPVADVDALARGLRNLVEQRWDRDAIRARFVEKFSAAAVTGRWTEIYQQLIDTREEVEAEPISA